MDIKFYMIIIFYFKLSKKKKIEMYDEAEKLFLNAKAYDKLNQFYQVYIQFNII